MLAYAMMPFGYISLYAADRAFYAADVAAGLYHPLAYYLASAAAAAPLLVVNTLCGAFAAYGLANLGPSLGQVAVFGGFMALEGLLSAQLLVAVRKSILFFLLFISGAGGFRGRTGEKKTHVFCPLSLKKKLKTSLSLFSRPRTSPPRRTWPTSSPSPTCRPA